GRRAARLGTGAGTEARRPRPGPGGRPAGRGLRRLRLPLLRRRRDRAARAAAAHRLPALPGHDGASARARGRLRRRGRRPPGRLLADARRAVRRPGPARRPPPVGARGAARPRRGSLRGRPALDRRPGPGARRFPRRGARRRRGHSDAVRRRAPALRAPVGGAVGAVVL
ncbi:MAG: hypothetical protein AVDCRST_MAG69-2059, partial [uncultured Solirubrobacteraceae bacterium]